jgi:hypothetical protein
VIKEQVRAALAELEEKIPGAAVRCVEDAEGGAHVLVEAVPIGSAFSPAKSWIGFHVTHSYPEAIPYPHFIEPVIYVGEGPTPNEHPDGSLPSALTRGRFIVVGEERDAIQVSRSSPGRDPMADTALAKLLRVVHFLRGQE